MMRHTPTHVKTIAVIALFTQAFPVFGASPEGLFGQPYSLKTGFVFTLVSAEYTIARVKASDIHIPNADEKLLLLHIHIRNATADEAYFNTEEHGFTAVDADGQDHTGGQDYGRTSTGEPIDPNLKEGQEYDDCYTCLNVPAKGAITKIILNAGRRGADDNSLAYSIGEGRNIIAPLPAFARDPGEPSGASTPEKINARPGAFYPLGQFDLRVDSVGFSDGPLADTQPDDGKQFMLVTLTMRNRTSSAISFYSGLFSATAVDDNDQEIPADGAFKPTKDEEADQHSVDPDDEYTVRYHFQVDKPADVKTITIAEGDSHAYVYAASMYK